MKYLNIQIEAIAHMFVDSWRSTNFSPMDITIDGNKWRLQSDGKGSVLVIMVDNTDCDEGHEWTMSRLSDGSIEIVRYANVFYRTPE